jgi:glycosyltransferase involved in cell wall biosynthesis
MNVHQFVPNLHAGDAVGSNILAIQSLLRARGFGSEIFCGAADAPLAGRVHSPQSYQPKATDHALYHHCMNNPLGDLFRRLPVKRAVVYHNITPARFFAPFEPWLASETDAGRDQLRRLVQACELGIGDSDFNTAELVAAGCARAATVPLLCHYENTQAIADTAMLRRLMDGKTNLLFVGRIAPSKKQDDCVRALAAYLRIDPQTRLILAGGGDFERGYGLYLRSLIRELGLQEQVLVTGKISAQEVAACYASANLYLSLSEHEGFGVPLVEAMRSDVPVLAFDAGAVSETLGGAGVLTRTRDFGELAGLIHVLARDPRTRARVIEGQRVRARDFEPERVGQRMMSVLSPWLGADRSPGKVLPLPRASKRRRRISFVVQRYGLEVNGGAELLARLIAERLAARSELDVEVLTTTAVDYRTWENSYPAGDVMLNGVRVRRFPVDRPRDQRVFLRMDIARIARYGAKADHEAWIDAQGPISSALLTAISAAEETDLFFFFTYLYHPTVHGVPRVAERAVLVPTLHDEPALEISVFDELMALPRALLCSTEEEIALARKRFVRLPAAIHLAGSGIHPLQRPAQNTFGARHGVKKFFLYAGRIEAAKGCGEMFDAYERYRSTVPEPLDLVLVGKAAMPIPPTPGIKALGFVDDAERDAALCAAHAVIVPSPYESLSMVLLEALSVGTPVLANAASPVLAGHVARSGAGKAYLGAQGLADAMALLQQSDAHRLGASGPAYVDKHYTWERVDGVYLDVIDRFARKQEKQHARRA